VACALAKQPGTAVHLVESTGKKADFLRGVAEALALPATVHHIRAESFSPGFAAEVITARALAPLPKPFGYVAPLLKSGAKALLPKGQDVEAELTEAAKCWNIEADMVVSRTNSAGRIVVVRALRRR
jgi:16S rRNA (guanine527-N7)-methyltransferase